MEDPPTREAASIGQRHDLPELATAYEKGAEAPAHKSKKYLVAGAGVGAGELPGNPRSLAHLWIREEQDGKT